LEDTSSKEKLKEIARKYALLNAYTHNGKAQPKAVLGKMLAEMPQLRQKAREITQLVDAVVEEVNRTALEEQKKIIEKNYPGLLEKKEVKCEEKVLPPLPNIEKHPYPVTRFSPNPDCVLHIGSARAIILSYEYAKMYKGKFILRFEDTDPRIKKPVLEFYDKIREDLTWLECKWDKEYIQSDRLEIYYDYAKKLLEMDQAYVCVCNPRHFQQYISKQQPCPCRSLPTEANMQRWEKMLNGTYNEGEAIVRVKTDLQHPNPAVRDWPALRIINTKKHPHPRVGDKYRVWPLYNLSCGIDDHLMGITHIIRGKEHLTNEVRQRYMYNYFNWQYPDTIHYGRLKIKGAVLSKSKIREGIEQGLYKGYDDPRLATFAALRRRGITPRAIRQMIIDVGTNPVDVTLSWETLFTYNRRIIDPHVNRYFFVDNPVKLRIKNIQKPHVAKLYFHPNYPERGFRLLQITPKQNEAEVFISKNDCSMLSVGKIIRLIELFNVKIEKLEDESIKASYHSETYEEAKKLKATLIHFLPTGTGVPTEIIMPDASIVTGLAEDLCKNLETGETVQFQRFGFVKIDEKSDEMLTAYFLHK
jgi:glutamyl-tRNA synthetase